MSDFDAYNKRQHPNKQQNFFPLLFMALHLTYFPDSDYTVMSLLLEEEAAQKAAEEAAAAAAAEEEAKGYETGITYDQLARTPDDYKGKKIKFYGKVLQVMEGNGNVQIRLAVNDDYDTVLYCEYQSDIVSSRVLEDDHITVYGTYYGLYSYQSTMGGTITIPAAIVERIDQ